MPYVEATGARLYFEECGYGYPSSTSMNSHPTCAGWNSQFRHFSRGHRCIAFNARGYPPSDIPQDAASYGWELGVDDIAAVMRGLGIERAHVVGSSMGGYAALQLGLRYPGKASAIVAAGVGSGSHPSHRDAWLRETSVLARVFSEHGMAAMAERMARGPARIQLKYKDPKSWQEFVARLRQCSPQGMANTMARCQALRPSVHDLRDQLSGMTVPVLLAVGDEDDRCLETTLMLKSTLPTAVYGSPPIPVMRSIWKSPRHSTLKSKTSSPTSSAGAGVVDICRIKAARNLSRLAACGNGSDGQVDQNLALNLQDG